MVCLQKALEEQLKPLTEHLGKLRGVPVPDFGPFDEWSNLKNALEAHRKRRAAGTLAYYSSNPALQECTMVHQGQRRTALESIQAMLKGSHTRSLNMLFRIPKRLGLVTMRVIV